MRIMFTRLAPDSRHREIAKVGTASLIPELSRALCAVTDDVARRQLMLIELSGPLDELF